MNKPTFLQRIREAFESVKIVDAPKTVAGKSPAGYDAQFYGYAPTAKKLEFLNELKGWVGCATTAIADEVGSIQLKLYRYDEENGVEEVDDHDIVDLLYKVNSFTTKFDHFWLTSAYLDLTGEAPWFLEWEKGKIVGIYILRPDRINPIVGDDRFVSGYRYSFGNNKEITLSPQEVIFLKNPDPANPLRGIGTLQMAARTVDVDNYSEEWNKDFYERAAHPDSLLTVKVENMSDEQKAVLKQSFHEQYQGFKNAHQTMVLFGDVDWKKVGFSQKDMDFLEQQKFSRDKILGIFRVPKAVVAQTEDVNLASAQTAQYIFAKYTIKPRLERLTQQLNEFLLPLFEGTENMFIDYENPVPEDKESDARVYQMGLNNWLTVNEIREEEGLEPVEGGDTIYLPFGMSPIGSAQDVNNQTDNTTNNNDQNNQKSFVKLTRVPVRKTKLQTDLKKFGDRIREMKARSKVYFEFRKIDKQTRKKIYEVVKRQYVNSKKNGFKSNKKDLDNSIKARVLSIEEKSAFWKKKNDLTDKFLPDVTEAMISIFQSQRKEIMPKFDEFKAFKIDPNVVYNKVKLDSAKEVKKTLKITMPIFADLFKEAGDETFKLLDVEQEMDITRENIKKLLNAKGRKFSKEVTDYTNSKLKTEIVNGLANGESMDEIKQRVKKLFVASEEYRANAIAQTETVRYNASATEQAFKDSGVVEAKEWFVNPDACEFCQPLAGKTVGLDESFLDKGETVEGDSGNKIEVDYETVDTPPLHVNCRCDLIPIFKK